VRSILLVVLQLTLAGVFFYLWSRFRPAGQIGYLFGAIVNLLMAMYLLYRWYAAGSIYEGMLVSGPSSKSPAGRHDPPCPCAASSSGPWIPSYAGLALIDCMNLPCPPCRAPIITLFSPPVPGPPPFYRSSRATCARGPRAPKPPGGGHSAAPPGHGATAAAGLRRAGEVFENSNPGVIRGREQLPRP
jgi:hypothetical protein